MIWQWKQFSIDVYRLLATFPVAWLLERILLFVGDRIFHRRRWLSEKQRLAKFLGPPLFTLFTLVGLDLSVTHIYAITERAYIVAAVWLMVRLVKALKAMTLNHVENDSAQNLVARKFRTLFEFIERSVNILLIVLGVALVLMTFDEARALGSSMIASAGLAGIAIGFAAQKSLSTFVSGFQVAFTQPIRLGDAVVMDGEWGTIEEITLTYVVVKIWDLRRLIVPINYFTERSFQNWTRTVGDLLGTVILNFDYSVDVDDLRRKFREILDASPLWDKRTAAVHVTDATERSMQIRFLLSARNAGEAFDLRCEVREKLIAYVRKAAPQALPRVRLQDDVRTVRRASTPTLHP